MFLNTFLKKKFRHVKLTRNISGDDTAASVGNDWLGHSSWDRKRELSSKGKVL